MRPVSLVCAAAVALVAARPVAAEPDTAAAEPEAEENRLSGAVQFDLMNAYYFRGILNERDGLVFQPSGELHYALYRSEDGPIRELSIGGGVWASIHTDHTLVEHGPHHVYEVDWYPVIGVELPYGLSLTTTYYYYTSPNGAFARVDELNLELAWDDSEALGRFALQPWVNFAIETQHTSFGDEEGVGVQLGVEPTLHTFEHPRYPVALTVPLELGFAVEDYYEEESGAENGFGYFQFGLSASVPLAFLPERAGAWNLTLTGSGLAFSNTLAEANRGRSLYPLFVLGLGVEF